MSGGNLLLHELPDLVGALVADTARRDGGAARRQLIENAGIKIAVNGESEGARDRASQS